MDCERTNIKQPLISNLPETNKITNSRTWVAHALIEVSFQESANETHVLAGNAGSDEAECGFGAVSTKFKPLKAP